jgi:voltage-gated potassium channel
VAFDISLIVSILLSITAIMLESVRSVRAVYGPVLYDIEWFFTGLFALEYMLRLISVRRPLRYATSFFGLVDLLAILPTFLSLLLPGTQYLFTVRILRLLRIFRILKLTEYLSEASDHHWRPPGQPAQDHRVHPVGAHGGGHHRFPYVHY